MSHLLRTVLRCLFLLGILSVWLYPAGLTVQAQDRPPERQIRSYIPPDQLVSFRPETPFDQFVEFLNPIFQRVTGKQVIDPESRSMPIGITVAGAQYFDAFELVLEYNGLTYRETDRFFIVEEAPEEETGMAGMQEAEEEPLDLPADIMTREVHINAVLFSVNLTKSRDVGIDWNVFFGGQTAAGGGGGVGGGTGGTGTGGTGTGGTGTGGTGQGGQGGQGGQQSLVPRFFVDAEGLSDALENVNILSPEIYDVSTLTQLFRLLEREGLGETVAQPSVTVQSGEEGRIQIGTDLPYVTRDFAGNTITQFVQTGIIIEVTPTVIRQPVADSSGAPMVDFIHMDVRVDNSSGQVSAAGPIVDRSTAETKVLLLNGEQTIIGGLYTTEETTSRRGIPILKDLPPWFFGIRYLTGITQKTIFQRELLILLQAKLIDPLRVRANRPFERNLLRKSRENTRETLKGLREDMPETEYPQSRYNENVEERGGTSGGSSEGGGDN
ncbi:MAG: general secretion pathway protein GspD [Bacteroidetes bacterium]|jgi:type IV pilus assembly protein PilQ|nr:general secretion pathway protein GspD [Bacteroidota bacterium]